MFEAFKTSLYTWNASKNERQKLQHSYLALTVTIVVIAGIISLFNGQLGHNVIKLALAALVVFACNAVVWNLLQSSVVEKLTTRPRRRP